MLTIRAMKIIDDIPQEAGGRYGKRAVDHLVKMGYCTLMHDGDTVRIMDKYIIERSYRFTTHDIVIEILDRIASEEQ